jgi:hypothetical protein
MKYAPLVALLCACAPATKAVDHPTSGTPARDEWTHRTWEDKYDLMTGIVLPEMSKVFQAFYKEEAPSLTCKGCHGDDAEKVAFKMPNDLPSLNPKHMPDPHEEMGAFMTEQVVPKMQQLLGISAGTGEGGNGKRGFGCFSCHPTRGAKK